MSGSLDVAKYLYDKYGNVVIGDYKKIFSETLVCNDIEMIKFIVVIVKERVEKEIEEILSGVIIKCNLDVIIYLIEQYNIDFNKILIDNTRYATNGKRRLTIFEMLCRKNVNVGVYLFDTLNENTKKILIDACSVEVIRWFSMDEKVPFEIIPFVYNSNKKYGNIEKIRKNIKNAFTSLRVRRISALECDIKRKIKIIKFCSNINIAVTDANMYHKLVMKSFDTELTDDENELKKAVGENYALGDKNR